MQRDLNPPSPAPVKKKRTVVRWKACDGKLELEFARCSTLCPAPPSALTSYALASTARAGTCANVNAIAVARNNRIERVSRYGEKGKVWSEIEAELDIKADTLRSHWGNLTEEYIKNRLKFGNDETTLRIVYQKEYGDNAEEIMSTLEAWLAHDTKHKKQLKAAEPSQVIIVPPLGEVLEGVAVPSKRARDGALEEEPAVKRQAVSEQIAWEREKFQQEMEQRREEFKQRMEWEERVEQRRREDEERRREWEERKREEDREFREQWNKRLEALMVALVKQKE